ncbi:hypothetical protein D1007_37230 [Hordeum vulgare]|nr:hypothetical protein D1007_37230 [Hordeum vulgare]
MCSEFQDIFDVDCSIASLRGDLKAERFDSILPVTWRSTGAQDNNNDVPKETSWIRCPLLLLLVLTLLHPGLEPPQLIYTMLYLFSFIISNRSTHMMKIYRFVLLAFSNLFQWNKMNTHDSAWVRKVCVPLQYLKRRFEKSMKNVVYLYYSQHVKSYINLISTHNYASRENSIKGIL